MQKYEQIFKGKLENQVVVSEFPLQKEQLDNFTNSIKKQITSQNEKKMIEVLWSRYPHFSLTMTVFIGAYYYQSGSLWPSITDKLGVENTTAWAEELYDFLENNNFKFVTTGNYKVNSVLLHSGISKFSIPYLVENIIVPANERGWNELDIYQHIDSFGNIHTGIKNFIELKDTLTFSMLHRIQTIWKNGDRPFVEKYSGYLPEHILVGLDECEADDKNPVFHYNAPYLAHDKEVGTVYLQIPSIALQDIKIDNMYWKIIADEVEQKIPLTVLNYHDDYQEFSPENERIELRPNKKYYLELYYSNSDSVNHILAREEEISTIPILVQFEEQKQLTRLTKIRIENKEFNSLSMIISPKKLEDLQKQKLHAFMDVKKLTGIWKNYFSLTIVATTTKETINIDGYHIQLTTLATVPYLAGDFQEHLAHADQPIFKQLPYIVLTEEVVSNIKKGFIHNLRFSHGNKVEFPYRIESQDIVFENGLSKLYLQEIINTDFEGDIITCTLELYGKLGYDYQFSFLLINNLDIQPIEEHITITLPADFRLTVQWPLNVQIEKKGNDFIINPPEKLFKMKLAIFNEKNDKFDFILYKDIYNINFRVDNETNYLLGETINREEWNEQIVMLDLDTTNPAFAKTFGQQENMTIKGKEITTLPIFANGFNSYHLNKMFTEDLQEDIDFYYTFSKVEDWKHLLRVLNQWNLLDYQEELDSKNIKIRWKQTNYLNEKYLRIWRLHEPEAGFSDVPLKKRTTTFSYNFKEPGVYLFEWKDNLDEQENRPIFKEGKHKIYYIGEIRSLAYHLLLAKDEESNYTESQECVDSNVYTAEKIKRLLEIINYFGKKYLNLILKDYNRCCDFSLREYNSIRELLLSKSLTPRLLSILSQITSIQEIDTDNLFKAYETDLRFGFERRFKEKFWKNKRSKFNYFAPYNLIHNAYQKGLKQLNIDIQESKPFDPIMKDFHLHTEFLRYIYKINGEHNNTYKLAVEERLRKYAKDIENLYNQVKRKSYRKISSEVFQVVDKRRNNKVAINHPKNFPYLIGQLACLNRLFIRGLENLLSLKSDEDQKLILIREATQGIITVNRTWFMHDLVYLELILKYAEIEKDKKKTGGVFE